MGRPKKGRNAITHPRSIKVSQVDLDLERELQVKLQKKLGRKVSTSEVYRWLLHNASPKRLTKEAAA